MIRDISRIANKKFDLLVIGGGINGAAIAHIASQAGASVALIDKGDFASGTSSKSTKLLHGGIRYLENFEFDLVRESLQERYVQWQAAPYLVKPLSFVIPVYKNDQRSLWTLQIGVWLYDLLSGRWKISQHKSLSFQDICQAAPGINREGLLGGVEYSDAQMDDARLCLENVLMADKHGAAVANYVKALSFIKEAGQAVGINAQDLLSSREFKIFAKKIIVAVGPWSDQIMHKDRPQSEHRMRLTKGVHIVYQGQISPKAFLLQSHQDRRILFVIPFKGNSLIGTTDTDYSGDIDDVKVEEQDISYLLQEASKTFPHITFDRSKIISSFAGLRPLVAQEGQPSKISRKHVIEKKDSGVYYVMGGKYTTYRVIAEEAVQKVFPELAAQLPHKSQYILYGSGGCNEEVKILSQRFNLPIDLIGYLQGIYGSKFMDILHIAQRDLFLKERICSCSPAIAAQVFYAKEVEMAQTVDDIVLRRLGLSYLECSTARCRRFIENTFKNP